MKRHFPWDSDWFIQFFIGSNYLFKAFISSGECICIHLIFLCFSTGPKFWIADYIIVQVWILVCKIQFRKQFCLERCCMIAVLFLMLWPSACRSYHSILSWLFFDIYIFISFFYCSFIVEFKFVSYELQINWWLMTFGVFSIYFANKYWLHDLWVLTFLWVQLNHLYL